jgi:hypothetical protein
MTEKMVTVFTRITITFDAKNRLLKTDPVLRPHIITMILGIPQQKDRAG